MKIVNKKDLPEIEFLSVEIIPSHADLVTTKHNKHYEKSLD